MFNLIFLTNCLDLELAMYILLREFEIKYHKLKNTSRFGSLTHPNFDFTRRSAQHDSIICVAIEPYNDVHEHLIAVATRQAKRPVTLIHLNFSFRKI